MKEEPEVKKEEPARNENIVQRTYPSLSDYTHKQLWDMHPDQFRDVFTGLQKKAVMTLSENDVRDFYIVMDIARRKSLAFANVATYVTQKYPELNVQKDYPTSHLGRMALLKSQKEEIHSTIYNASKEFALLYFYSPECHFCDAQNEINRMFVNKYDWQMKRINIFDEPVLAEKFGARTVPALILIYKNSSDYITASLGVITLSELEDKLFRSIRLLRGDIAPQDYSLFDFQKGGSFDITEGGFIEGLIREDKAKIH